MGAVLSRFRKKKSSFQVLEDIEEEITLMESDRQSTMMKQKKYFGRLVIYTILLYFVLAASFYFLVFYRYNSLRDGVLCATPLVIIPVLFVIAKKGLNWYFSKAMTRSKEKLMDLRAKKKKILDEVMEKETFKVAKDILEKFAPDQLTKSESLGSNGLEAKLKIPEKLKPSQPSSPVRKVDQSGLKNQLPQGSDSSNQASEVKGSPPVMPSAPSQTSTTEQQLQIGFRNPSPARYQSLPQNTGVPSLSASLFQQQSSNKRRLVRPVLPQQIASRGVMDRLIEYLVGDGPSNRYALICNNCSSHNGMALKEEFEFISFRCAYCGFPNPSRKDKPRKPIQRGSFSAAESGTITTSSHSSSTQNIAVSSTSSTSPGNVQRLGIGFCIDRTNVRMNSDAGNKYLEINRTVESRQIQLEKYSSNDNN